MTERHVYVVDDEDAIRRSSRLMLKVMGYQTEVFASGTEFLKTSQQLPPGCVLLDIRMPDIDGIEVQRTLTRVSSPHSVIVMSGHGDRSVAVPAMEGGAVAFLEKPFPRGLLEKALAVGFLRIEDVASYQAHLEEAAAAVARLGDSDRAVLEQFARGQGTEAIGGSLGLAGPVVELARARIFAELQVESITEALGIAFAAARASGSTVRNIP